MSGPVASARAVGRADRILELVATAATPPSVTAVARALDLPLSSTADLLRELRATGWVRLRGRGHVLGHRPYVLGLLAGVGPPTALTHTDLDALSRAARAPVALAVLVGGQVRYVDHAGPRAPDRLQRVTDDHRPRPPLRTAAGRLLLALGDPEESARGLAGVDDPPAVAAYLAERPEIVRTRLARSDGLADPAIRAVAVPVEEGGETVAAAVLTGTRRGRADRSVTLDRAAARLAAALAARGTQASWGAPVAGPTGASTHLQPPRALVIPDDVGLSGTGTRRTPGLHREAVATPAGIGIDHHVRLEKGRDTKP